MSLLRRFPGGKRLWRPCYMRMKGLPTALSTNPKSLPARENSCVRVALDVPLPKLFEYSLPEEIEARAGDRVAVRFGAQQKIGVVIEDSITPQLAADRIKPIAARRDDAPRLAARLDCADAFSFGLLPPAARRNRDQRAAAALALDETAAEKGAAERGYIVRHAIRAEPRAHRAAGGRGRAHSLRVPRLSAAWGHRQRQDRGLPQPGGKDTRARRAGA